MAFSREWRQTGDQPRQREKAHRARAFRGKESFMQTHDMFSEAQDDEKKWEGKWNLVLILAKNCSWSFISFMELIIRECNISNVSACVWGLV